MTPQQNRQQLYDSLIVKNQITKGKLVIVANVPGVIARKTGTMIANKYRYLEVAHRFVNPGLKWWLVALIHEMECSQNFNCHLHNGDPLIHKTVHVPAGRPLGDPPFTFLESAIDALKMQGADRITDWSIGNVLFFLEGYNGYGYSRYKNMNSPYLWSGSNHYTCGKYVSDGKSGWDPTAVSSQIGVALLMKKLLE